MKIRIRICYRIRSLYFNEIEFKNNNENNPMKTLSFALLALIIFFGCTDTKYESTDNKLSEYELIGHVKSVKYYDADYKFKNIARGKGKLISRNLVLAVTFDPSENPIVKEYYDQGGIIYSKCVFTYDKKGNLFKKEWFDSRDRLEKSIIFRYDNRNNPVEIDLFTPENKLNQKYTCMFNEKNQMSEEKQQLFGDKVYALSDPDINMNPLINRYSNDERDSIGFFEHSTYIYDNKGNRIEALTYNIDDSLINKTTYRYDDSNNLTEEINITSTDSIFTRFVYKYQDDKLVEEVKYDHEGSIEEKCLYKYDKRNNRVEYFLPGETADFSNILLYKYDRNNNWIRRIIYTKFIWKLEFDPKTGITRLKDNAQIGNDYSVREREIEYFN